MGPGMTPEDGYQGRPGAHGCCHPGLGTWTVLRRAVQGLGKYANELWPHINFELF